MARHVRRPQGGRHRMGPQRVHARVFLGMTRVRRFPGRWFHANAARHSFRSISRSGLRPRRVFAIIASL